MSEHPISKTAEVGGNKVRLFAQRYKNVEEVLPDIKKLLADWKMARMSFHVEDNGELLVCREPSKEELEKIKTEEVKS